MEIKFKKSTWTDKDARIARTMMEFGMARVVRENDGVIFLPQKGEDTEPIRSTDDNAFSVLEVGKEASLEEIVKAVDKMNGRIFEEGYPCKECERKNECGAERGCDPWRSWFKTTWKGVRMLYGRID